MEAEISNRRMVNEVKIKQLELEAAAKAVSPVQPSPMPVRGFEVSRNVALVPQFRVAEVDSYSNCYLSGMAYRGLGYIAPM